MLSLAFAALIAAAQGAPAPAPCGPNEQCATANAAQMFALADKLYTAGDKAGAAAILEALTQDKHPELRAEARFRLAAVQESMGDLKGAAGTLRALLAEQPDANRARLELARILSRLGDKKGARREVAAAEAAGLPQDVLASVRQFSTSIAPRRRRGLTIELSGGPDSNINRATSSQYIDTIIAPFVLDADARRRAGAGFTASGQGWSRDPVGGIDLLTRVSGRADLFNQGRFNDIQASADSGPQWSGKFGTLRAAATVERRWYGGRGFSSGYGASIAWRTTLGTRNIVELGAARVRQNVDQNPFQDGWRTNINAGLTHALGRHASARLTLGWAALDARVRPESLRQWGADILFVRDWRGVTLFGEAGLTKTRSRAPLFLFGEPRRDRRIDLSAGVVLSGAKIAGFAPLFRISHTDSSADIVLFDYRRTRVDVGFTRSF